MLLESARAQAVPGPHSSPIWRLSQLNKVVDEADENRVRPWDEDSSNLTKAFVWAVNHGQVALVDHLLLDERVDPCVDENGVTYLAARNGHNEVVERLLRDRRVDPSDANNAAIRLACHFGHSSVVDMLLQDKRADPSANDNAAIRSASRNGHLKTVTRLLLDPRVDPGAIQNAAVHGAIHFGHTEVVVRLLLDARIYVGPRAFDRLPDATRNEALRLFQTNSMPFDFASLLRDSGTWYMNELRMAQQAAHDRALTQIATVLRSGSLAKSLPDDILISIVWTTFGNVLFPLFPLKSRNRRIAQLVSSISGSH